MKTTRRSFLKSSMAVPFILPSTLSIANTLANDRIRTGLIGAGRMGASLLNNFRHNTQVVAVSDVDTNRREHFTKLTNEFYKQNPKHGEAICKSYENYEDLIARDDIDAVVIATPDHWHATQIIDAVRAGKDVYSEKPLTHDMAESVEVMREVEKAGRVLQTGSWQRSTNEFRIAAELVRNETAGKVLSITTSFGGPSRPYDLPEEPMEPGLNWNLWLGPAPKLPYNSLVCPRGIIDHFPLWRRYTEFSGGWLADMAAHHLDIVQWALDMDNSGPVKAVPPKNPKAGNGAKLVYANGLEVEHTSGIAITFKCENGIIQVDRGKFNFEMDGKTIAKFTKREDGGTLRHKLKYVEDNFLKDATIRLQKNIKGHSGDFLQCMKTRKKPIANEIVGARTAICCHLLNMTYHKAQEIKWNPETNTFADSSCNPEWLTGSRRDYKNAKV